MTPTVSVTPGLLAGTEITTSSGPVLRYAGIPYAQPPVGELRFAAPQPAKPWPGTYDATDFGPSPVQDTSPAATDTVPGMRPNRTDEDCLTLNVWTPVGTNGTDLPVLAWIYGGGFSTGGTAFETYDAARLAAEQQVVVISLNYRVGALGFLDLREYGGDQIGAASNVGLRDQLLALQWVRDNVTAFGGDAKRITVFGESAGAGSVVHLIGTGTRLFHRAIAQSPGVEFTQRPATSAKVARALLERLGVDEAKALLDVPAQALLEAQIAVATDLLGSVGAMAFHPYLDDDLVRARPLDAFSQGAGATVDLLIGAAADEMRLYLEPSADGLDDAGLTRWAQGLLRCDESAARRVLAAYPAGKPSDRIAAILTDRSMRLPIYALADRHQGRTYAYSFDWQADGGASGAFHAIDLPFTFDTFDRGGWTEFLGADEGAYQVGRALRSAWAAFAATGDPSCEATGYWPPYEPRRRTLRLNAEITLVEDPLSDIREAWVGV
jgi:para-nitrobenzyl esterase